MTGNAIDRVPSVRNPATSVDVFSVGDFPNPILADDGVMRIPWERGVSYVVHQTIFLPRVLLPTSPTEGVAVTELISVNQGVLILMAGDEIPHFWGRDVGNISLERNIFVDVSNGGLGRGTVLFDLVGQGPDISTVNPQGALLLRLTGLLNFLEVGRVVDMRVGLLESGWGFMERGLVIRNVEPLTGQIVESLVHIQAVPMTTPMLCYQGPHTVVSISGGNIDNTPTDSSFCIDSAADGEYNYIGLAYGGVAASGNFFQPDISVSITEFEDDDIAFASVSDSTVNPGVDSTINFTSLQREFIRGQQIFLEGATVATYDGAHTIVRVASDLMSFDINVAFGATTAGDVKLTIVSAVAHGLASGQTNTISGTTNYNFTTEVFDRPTNDTFRVPLEFLGDDATGTVSATSKNGQSLGVNVAECGDERPSRSIGGCHTTGPNTTVVSGSTWTSLDLSTNPAVANDDEERFAVTDADTGEITYLDNAPLFGYIRALMTIETSGVATFQIRAVLNGTTHVGGIVVGQTSVVGTDSMQLSLLVPVLSLELNDTLNIEIQNIASAADPTLLQFFWSMLGS